MIHSFLIIGQSNMAGRGNIKSAEPLNTLGGRLQVLRNGRWQTMFRPLNPDRAFSGTCLAENFAKAYALDHPDVNVGIIPCADGGTSLDQWREGGLLFDNAVSCARLAMRTSYLVGILWHQGEGDCAKHLYPLYTEKLKAIMASLRKALDAEGVPIVVGGLGDYLSERAEEDFKNYVYVNEALKAYAESEPHTAFASAKGLTSNSDLLHFNHESLMEFGIRYYEAYKTVEDKNRTFEDNGKTEDDARTELERL